MEKSRMRKYIAILLSLTCILAAACGCGQHTPTWQEQYDLGVRYLSEGKYEEAVIAFTAAIEIDPKQADAYLGLADAYIALDDLARAEQVMNDALHTVEKTEAVQAKLDSLREVLAPPEEEILSDAVQSAVEDTADKSVTESETKVSEQITLRGHAISNYDEYRESIDAFLNAYTDWEAGVGAGVVNEGIRFAEPYDMMTDDGPVLITEACFGFPMSGEEFNSLIGADLEVTGYFYEHDVIEGPQTPEEMGLRNPTYSVYYGYYPNGPWTFFVSSYEIIE